MTQDELQAAKKSGNFKQDEAPKKADFELPQSQEDGYTLDEFIPLLLSLRMPHRALTVAPTFTPQTFLDSIQYYDAGGVRRLYLFVVGTWRFVVLT